MTRDEMLVKLRDLKPWLEEQGIVNVRLFGSIVGMRNRIAHGSSKLNPVRISEAASLSVPPFAEQIKRLRAKLEAA